MFPHPHAFLSLGKTSQFTTSKNLTIAEPCEGHLSGGEVSPVGGEILRPHTKLTSSELLCQEEEFYDSWQ